MEKFINTKKEQFLGFDFLKNHTLPSRDVFDYRVHKKEYSEYFAQYGFQVSMVYADFYSRMWCSDYNEMIGICRMMCITIMLFLA